MSSGLEARKQHAAALRSAAARIRDILIYLAYFQTDLDRNVGLMRQLKRDAEAHGHKRPPPAFVGGLFEGLPGGLFIAWLAHGFLGG